MEWNRGIVLGRGSFGTVNLVSVKKETCGVPEIMVVKSAPLSGSSSLKREKHILTQLHECQQIIQCFGEDLSVENGVRLYNLFLEYVPGGTLADLMKKRGGVLKELDARRYMKSILRGLCFLHCKGMVHCDIKLQNILVYSNSEVKIADFGLAKLAREKETLRGSPLYMAPESIVRNEQESASDIWSLGCVLIEMMTGKPAWKFSETYDVETAMFQIGFGRELPDIPSQVSETGKDFLRKCLHRDPLKRWTADMLLKHPFVSQMEEDSMKFSGSIESPRSFFDFTYCDSTSSINSASSSPNSNSYSGLVENFNQTNSCSSSCSIEERIQKLATTKLPSWFSSDKWIVVRKQTYYFLSVKS